jgi:hypothetical protein
VGNSILIFSILIFLTCSVNAQTEVSPDKVWAEQRCGGNTAYKKDEKKFTECVSSKLLEMAPTIKNGRLLLGPEMVEGRETIYDCKVLSIKVKYLAFQPYCSQNAKCKRYLPSASANESETKVEFNCIIPMADQGCLKKSWQECAIDPTLPEGFDLEKCMKSQPGELPAGCPDTSSGNRGKKNDGGTGIR